MAQWAVAESSRHPFGAFLTPSLSCSARHKGVKNLPARHKLFQVFEKVKQSKTWFLTYRKTIQAFPFTSTACL